jgi:hypothetical protein
MYTNNNTYFIDYFERNDFLSLLFEDLSFSVFNKYYCFMNCNICYLKSNDSNITNINKIQKTYPSLDNFFQVLDLFNGNLLWIDDMKLIYHLFQEDKFIKEILTKNFVISGMTDYAIFEQINFYKKIHHSIENIYISEYTMSYNNLMNDNFRKKVNDLGIKFGTIKIITDNDDESLIKEKLSNTDYSYLLIKDNFSSDNTQNKISFINYNNKNIFTGGPDHCH